MAGVTSARVWQRLVESARARRWTAWAGLALILIGAGVVRFWNLGTGLPYRVAVDEPVIAERAVHILRTGDFNPHFFDYPGLYIYTQVAVACARFIAGALDGSWRSLDEFWPQHLFLWTRLLNASLGVATVLLVFRAGSRWGPLTGLLAAALLAVWPNHVRESHFALTDIPLTFFTTLALVRSLTAYETGRLANFLIAGAVVGLAAATKYNGAAAILMPVLAAATTRQAQPSRLLCALSAMGASAAAFVVAAPFTILDLPAFLNAFAYLATAYRPRGLMDGASIYLGHLQVAIGGLGLAVLASGVLWGVWHLLRLRDAGRWLILLVFPILYFHMIATKDLIYARYLLPAIPFACVLMAIVIADAGRWLISLPGGGPWRPALAVAVFMAALVHPTRASLEWALEHGERTTQDLAYRLVREWIPLKTRVAIEASVIRLPDADYAQVNIRNLTLRTVEEWKADGVTHLIASGEVFGPPLDDAERQPDAHASYTRLFDSSECLPDVEPTKSARGPRIRICRFKTP